MRHDSGRAEERQWWQQPYVAAGGHTGRSDWSPRPGPLRRSPTPVGDAIPRRPVHRAIRYIAEGLADVYSRSCTMSGTGHRIVGYERNCVGANWPG